MLLVPIGFGMLIGNIPFNATAGLEVGIYEEGRCSISFTMV